jgi:hypothetical protein
MIRSNLAVHVFLTDFHVEGDWTLLSLSRLKLNGIAFVQIFDLATRREAPTMKENIVAAIIRSDEAVTFLSYDLLDRSSHLIASFDCSIVVAFAAMSPAANGLSLTIRSGVPRLPFWKYIQLKRN